MDIDNLILDDSRIGAEASADIDKAHVADFSIPRFIVAKMAEDEMKWKAVHQQIVICEPGLGNRYARMQTLAMLF